ncbi:hypothetical protein RYX36_016994 [Vicia faba]
MGLKSNRFHKLETFEEVTPVIGEKFEPMLLREKEDQSLISKRRTESSITIFCLNMGNLLKYVGVFTLMFALMIGAFECKKIQENESVFSFGGRKFGAVCGAIGPFGGCHGPFVPPKFSPPKFLSFESTVEHENQSLAAKIGELDNNRNDLHESWIYRTQPAFDTAARAAVCIYG